MDPVSRNRNFSRAASSRAVVLLPAPAGPSIVTIMDLLKQDLYIGDALPMTALLHALQLPLCDLNEQISDTCLGLQAVAVA